MWNKLEEFIKGNFTVDKMFEKPNYLNKKLKMRYYVFRKDGENYIVSVCTEKDKAFATYLLQIGNEIVFATNKENEIIKELKKYGKKKK